MITRKIRSRNPQDQTRLVTRRLAGHRDRRRRMSIALGAVCVGLLGVLGAAHAVVLSDAAGDKLTQRYDSFVDVAGFERVVPSVVLDSWYTRKQFPDPDTTSACGIDAGINGATKALMLVDSQEPPLPHVRYRITYRLEEWPDLGGETGIFVEVTRFNLGPALRADVQATVPKGVPVAPRAEFGVGPSVSWRFVMRAMQCRFRDVVRAARRKLSDAQAQAMDCLGVSCLATTNPTGPDGDWPETRPPPMKPAPYVTLAHGVSTAARISELLYRHASHGKDNIEPLRVHGDTPQLTFVISMNTTGQDDTADALLHQGLLRDDAVSGIWTRRRDAGGDAVKWRQRIQRRSGRD